MDENDCPWCGVKRCRDLFDAQQIKELETPTYYAVHQLSVPCYYLQHNLYTERGWREVRKLLAEFLAGLTPAEARRQMGKTMSGNKGWSLTKGPKLAAVDEIEWTVDVSQVRLDAAENYCADIQRWARSVLDDTKDLAG